jgi:hypothetical protein
MEKVLVIELTQPFQRLVFRRAIFFLETKSVFFDSPVSVIEELVFDKLEPIRLASSKGDA